MNMIAHPSSGPLVPSSSLDPTAAPNAVTLAAFLDQVAGVLRQGLPARLWVEATVLAVRASTHGHAVELVDSTPSRGTPASLRAFLSAASLTAIGRDLDLALDPVVLVGLTTVLLIEPGFSPRWGLSARVVGLAGSAAVSLRRRVLEQAVATLRREGVWDRQHRLPRPSDVTRIAVIHPAGSAGWADVGTRLDRWQSAGIVAVRSVPTPFEGDGAAAALVTRIRDAAATPIHGAPPDLLLIVRGGGARAGLTLFDDLAIARAVCLSPIPVVTGIGHAIDDSLADRVAFRSTPTPSLAVTLVGTMIGETARRAAVDHSEILALARHQTTDADQRLTALLQRIAAALQRCCADAAATLALRWSVAQVEAARRREALARLGDGADGLLAQVRAVVPALIDSLERGGRTLLGDSLDRAFRVAGRHDGGAALVEGVGHAARALLERGETACGMALDVVWRTCDDRFRDADADLVRLGAVVDGSDVETMLRRGFALVTGASGAVLRTRTAAVAAPVLTLHFADGTVEAVPMSAGSSAGA